MITRKLDEYIRVLRLARKPSREEFSMIAKVCIAGTALIGFIGFLVYCILDILPSLLAGK
ncbi:MAG: protein translocase SEC61 complex subunit gamma [Methanosarcinales archaeon]|nr:MAG: protein translocase SEC61 complex subunit gamma [Methanosarcinales archaeon]